MSHKFKNKNILATKEPVTGKEVKDFINFHLTHRTSKTWNAYQICNLVHTIKDDRLYIMKPVYKGMGRRYTNWYVDDDTWDELEYVYRSYYKTYYIPVRVK